MVAHLVAPPTALTLLELINRCPKLEAVQVHPSRLEKLSEPSLCLLNVQGVKILQRSEYYTVDDGLILQKAAELQVECFESEEILAKVAEEAKVSPVLVGFILGR